MGNSRGNIKSALQHFQIDRLHATYADLATSKDYQELAEFFFSDIYGPKDYSRRNAAFKRLSYFLKDAMGARIFAGVEKLIELNPVDGSSEPFYIPYDKVIIYKL